MLTLKYSFDLSSFHLQCLRLQFSDELKSLPREFQEPEGGGRLFLENVTAELPLCF